MSWGIAACHAVAIRHHRQEAIGLAFAEGRRDVPFEIARVYYLWGLNPGDRRGEHAHKALQQVYICVHGAIDVVLRDDLGTQRIRLDKPEQGLYLGPMVWRHLEPQTPGAVLLVLASEVFAESDYYRRQEDYLAAATELRRATSTPPPDQAR
jgi:hypothetical protein